jgi:hypothetical protein
MIGATAVIGLPASPAASISIDPNVNDLVLAPGDTFSEVITVIVPANAGVSKADVYFLADTTGSMSGFLSAVQAGANNILTTLSGLAFDFAYGVGNYKDFPTDVYAFQHQLSLTNVAADVTAAIGAWSAGGGNDGPEGQFYALDKLAEPPGGATGWRPDSKRIIVWFGDAPGHDPICAAISGEASDITEASVTAKLLAETIAVIAISTAPLGFGMDADPLPNSFDYGVCGAPGGSADQPVRIAAATGGAFASGIDPANIVDTIINLVTNAVASINNLSLVATGGTAPFVTSISPAGGYGPLPGDVDHSLPFKVEFTGVVACSDTAQVFTGTIDAVADGVIVARKRVRITVPPCRPKELYSYSVKFVCGLQKERGDDQTVVRPGLYATEINIHNYHDNEVRIEKYVLPVVYFGSPAGREPNYVKRMAQDSIVLPPNTATMDDCYRISELLSGGVGPAPIPLTIGFFEILSPEKLHVAAVYTATDLNSGSLSIDVEQFEGKLK